MIDPARDCRAQSRPRTHFLRDGEEFSIGQIRIRALHTPGHTSEHLCYLITDAGSGARQPLAMATGDFVFVGDVGRPDLLETAAGQPEPPLYFAAMKRLNRDGAPVTGGPPTVRTLTGHEAMQAAALPTTAIVDCRDDRAAFLSAHVPRSIYAPLRSSQFEMAAGSYVPESHTVLLVAENQDAASLATLRFYRMGWDGVVGWISPEAWVKSGGELVAMPRVRFEEFDAHAAAARGQLLDVRSAAEHQTERIDGAHNVAHTRLASHLPDLLPKQKLFVHCGTGRRATLAVSYLRAQGVDAVLVDGNFDARKRVPSQAPTRE